MALTHKTREAIAGYIFISPNFIGFFIFLVFPIVCSLFISFADWNLMGTAVFVGLNNYKNLFGDSLFWKSLLNTLYFSFGSVLLNIILSLFLASLLTRKIKGVNFFRSSIFLPTVFSIVAIALIWQWLLNYEMGLINIFFNEYI